MPVLEHTANTSLDISQKIVGVETKYYRQIFVYIDALNKRHEFRNNPGRYDQARYVIANYVYLVHERLELKTVRDISYGQVKEWASENRELVRYLLISQFPDFEIAAFDRWIQPETQILKMAMYSSSNRHTKNTYH